MGFKGMGNGKETEMLKTEQDTEEVKLEIEKLAQSEVVFEHGQWWVIVDGEHKFSVIDTNNGLELEYLG